MGLRRLHKMVHLAAEDAANNVIVKIKKTQMQIGNHILKNNLVVAPMAGVTDRPFRMLCKKQIGRAHV